MASTLAHNLRVCSSAAFSPHLLHSMPSCCTAPTLLHSVSTCCASCGLATLSAHLLVLHFCLLAALTSSFLADLAARSLELLLARLNFCSLACPLLASSASLCSPALVPPTPRSGRNRAVTGVASRPDCPWRDRRRCSCGATSWPRRTFSRRCASTPQTAERARSLQASRHRDRVKSSVKHALRAAARLCGRC
eukprot:6213423-Pleurochrysis_carterae.AAC.3